MLKSDRDGLIKLELSNGVTLEGKPDLIMTMLKSMGVTYVEDGVHYMSSTQGLVPIVKMDTQHIRNAILKMYSTWVEELRREPDATFVTKLKQGAGDRNITLLALVKELTNRV